MVGRVNPHIRTAGLIFHAGLVSYYLHDILESVGVTDPNDQAIYNGEAQILTHKLNTTEIEQEPYRFGVSWSPSAFPPSW